MKASSSAASGRGIDRRAAGQRRGLGTLCLGLALLVGMMAVARSRVGAEEPPTSPAAQPAAAAKPGPNDRQITLAVRSYLEREHFTRRPIDDEIEIGRAHV